MSADLAFALLRFIILTLTTCTAVLKNSRAYSVCNSTMEIFLNLEVGLNVKYNPDYLNNHNLCVSVCGSDKACGIHFSFYLMGKWECFGAKSLLINL